MKKLPRFYAFALLACIVFYAHAELGPEKKIKVKTTSHTAERRIKKTLGCSIINMANAVVTPPICDNRNGSITGVQVTATGGNVQYFWLNEHNDVVGTHLDLTGVPTGTYVLQVLDNSGCTTPAQSAFISLITTTGVIISGAPDIAASSCINNGSITGLKVTNATNYAWFCLESGLYYDSTTTPDLTNIPAGTYQLTASNKTCSQTASYSVPSKLVLPVADGPTLCLSGYANIVVKNRGNADSYKLYANQTDTMPIAANKTGELTVYVDHSTDLYLVSVLDGCESPRVPVHVTVEAGISVPNTFTPNGDGINDSWNITGIEMFPGAEIRVYNRFGAQVYHSVNNAIAFNGNYKGKPLPAGVYYYLINVKQPSCSGKLSGSLTLIR